ncbi:MAG: hypothetical protein ACKO0M_12405 [Cyanobium sp.]
MEDPLRIPAAISYRRLQALAQAAPVEPAAGSASPDPTDEGLEAALEAWSRSSHALLEQLQQAGPALAEGRNPRQLMALGALHAHVAMGLQALTSSRRPRG